MREIEIKLKVANLEELEKELLNKGFSISKDVSQHDVVYTTSNEDYGALEGKEGYVAVRIRRQDNINILTLKQQRSHQLDNIEYETEIQDFQVMDNILKILGWKPVVEVKKKRRRGKLGEYEICLDQVEGLGNFIELEKLTDDNSNPKIIEEELFKALIPFGLTKADQEKKGYDTLIYLKNKK